MKKPGYSIDLIKQMAECDANYIRLLKLIPQLRVLRKLSLRKKALLNNGTKALNSPAFTSSPSSAGLPHHAQPAALPDQKLAEFVIADNEHSKENTVVEIKVVESFKYTTTLEITQRPELGGWIRNPTMQVRIYHDASTAEVTSYQHHRNFLPRYTQPNARMYQPDEKMQVNRFLGEWLTLCLHAGRCLKVPDIAFN